MSERPKAKLRVYDEEAKTAYAVERKRKIAERVSDTLSKTQPKNTK